MGRGVQLTPNKRRKHLNNHTLARFASPDRVVGGRRLFGRGGIERGGGEEDSEECVHCGRALNWERVRGGEVVVVVVEE